MAWLKENYKKFLIIIFVTSVTLAIGVFFYLYGSRYGLSPIFEYDNGNEFKIYFLDVGQGDAELIRTAQGQNILIDGGPDKSILSALTAELPWWDKTIEALIVTHSHDDHLAGLIEVLKRYDVKKIYFADNIRKNELLDAFLSLAADKRVPIVRLKNNYKIEFAPNALELMVATGTLRGVKDIENEESLVSELETPTRQNVLLMADAGVAREQALMRDSSGLRAQILKIGHHGSDYSSSEEFVKFTGASEMVISVGKGNSYGHPSPRVLKRLERLKSNIFRTDFHGTVGFKYAQEGWSLD